MFMGYGLGDNLRVVTLGAGVGRVRCNKVRFCLRGWYNLDIGQTSNCGR